MNMVSGFKHTCCKGKSIFSFISNINEKISFYVKLINLVVFHPVRGTYKQNGVVAVIQMSFI
jgi:hypothetical protein